jgi:anti-sigma factor RsiW
MEAGRIADLHAYVDDCLKPDGRLAFEQQMEQDPALARRAMLWRIQNDAIRMAFDSDGAKAFSIVRQQAETLGGGRSSVAIGGKPSCDEQMRLSPPTTADPPLFSAKAVAPTTFLPWVLWRLGFASLSVCLSVFWATATIVAPSNELGEAGVAAFQAFSRPGIEPVEFASSDRIEAQAWLTARLTHPVYIPAAPSAVRLVGARIAPYSGSPVAFLAYQSQERPVALLIQSLDAPATSAPRLLTAANGRTAVVWTWRSQGFALVGDPDAASLLKIATDFFDPPVEAAQIAPERGR